MLLSICTQGALKCFDTWWYNLLRGQMIVGVNNDYVREKLLTDPAMWLYKTIHLCKATQQIRYDDKEHEDCRCSQQWSKVRKVQSASRHRKLQQKDCHWRSVVTAEANSREETALHTARNTTEWDTLQLFADQARENKGKHMPLNDVTLTKQCSYLNSWAWKAARPGTGMRT